jgi:outer membrane protein assembly factor BamB
MSRKFLPVLLALCATAAAGDWPNYRGPNRDDISTEKGLLKEWPKEGPKLLWTYRNLGAGLSGPAVVGDRLYILGGRGKDDLLIALDISGAEPKELYATRVGPIFDWSGNQWSSGPSATPTVDGDRIYALGGNGDLLCANRADGKEIWRRNLPKDLDAEINPIGGGPKKLGWGFTWSPVVDGDRLICLPGGPKGTVAALNRMTGDVVWRSTELTDQAAYTSPAAAEIDGVKQYVILTNQGVYGVAAADGKVLWSQKRKYGTEVINTPIVRKNLVFVTVGSGQGAELLKIEREAGSAFKVTSVYNNKSIANHHGNVILLENHLYGHSQGSGWTCQAFETGEIAWSDRKVRPGAIVYADGRFYSLAENDGTVSLVEATPMASKEVSKFRLPQVGSLRKPKQFIWTPPVISGGKLLLRDQELLFCYDISAKP